MHTYPPFRPSPHSELKPHLLVLRSVQVARVRGDACKTNIHEASSYHPWCTSSSGNETGTQLPALLRPPAHGPYPSTWALTLHTPPHSAPCRASLHPPFLAAYTYTMRSSPPLQLPADPQLTMFWTERCVPGQAPCSKTARRERGEPFFLKSYSVKRAKGASRLGRTGTCAVHGASPRRTRCRPFAWKSMYMYQSRACTYRCTVLSPSNAQHPSQPKIGLVPATRDTGFPHLQLHGIGDKDMSKKHKTGLKVSLPQPVCHRPTATQLRAKAHPRHHIMQAAPTS